MTATSDLRAEHVGIARMLTILRHMARDVEAGDPPNVPALDESIEFLRVFADDCHHEKEERFLFPAMLDAGLPKVEDTIDVLLAEHVRGRELVARLGKVTDAASEGVGGVGPELVSTINEYDQLLSAHIRREENDCFPIADAQLPTDVQARLQDGYDRLEREVIGEGRHEAFEAMLERLAAEFR